MAIQPLEGGGPGFEIAGTFLEIELPHRLVFTHTFPGGEGHPLQAAYADHASLVTLTLRPTAAGSALRLEETALPSRDASDILAEGWPAVLDQLARWVAAV